MTDETIPLFDGSEIDLQREVNPVYRTAPVDDTDAILLRTDFATEDNNWERGAGSLTNQTVGGGSQSFDGLAGSAGGTTTTLNTGSTSTGDLSALVGPTINYSNWTEVAFYALGVSHSHDSQTFRSLVGLTDANDIPSSNNSYQFNTFDGRLDAQVKSGGAQEDDATILGGNIDLTAAHDLGFRIYNYGDGYNVDFLADGEFLLHSVKEPGAQDLSFRTAIRTDNTSTDRTITIDALQIVLIP